MPRPQPPRIAETEVLIRDVNERIAEKALELAAGDVPPAEEKTEFLCACGRADCERTIVLTVAEFERAHSSNDRFVVAPGHEMPEIEDVVAHRGHYLVVEKKPGHKPEDVK
jgi:hypothetical protein